MLVVTTRNELGHELRRASHAGKIVGLVPTMGWLHEGHLSLIREARRRTELLVVTIFVNPTQFGPAEDLEHYPRDLDRDAALCEACGADLLFAPTFEEVYPPGFDTRIVVGQVTEGLCGERRPDHFSGVATVVLKLFNLVRPRVAVFGQKDFQQLLCIRKLVRDLDLEIEVVGMPTVREPDGLAMSSRNAYLGTKERQAALGLPRGLDAAERAFIEEGEREVRKLEAMARTEMEACPGLRIDYLQVRDAQDLAIIERVERPAVLAGAVFVGSTRLIDNRIFDPGMEA